MSSSEDQDELLAKAQERANTAQTMFMLLDSDADGYVASEQLGVMLTSMLLSQEMNYDGDVDDYVLQLCRHRNLTKVDFNEFVDIYNGLVDRVKLQECMMAHSSSSASAASSSSAAGSSSDLREGDSPGRRGASLARSPLGRRSASGSAYLVSGAALKAVNGVYSQSGESDGVPKYAYGSYSLLRRTLPGGMRYWYITDSSSEGRAVSPGSLASTCYYCLRNNQGTPPVQVAWERAKDGLLPGPFLTPISKTHAPPASVQAPLQNFEVGDYVRANWAGRGVLYAGEVLATNRENDTVDILYDDGDFESHVPRERVHAVTIELTDAFHAYSVGDVVKADLKGHGSWYTGRIIAIDTKFRVFTIKYENNQLEKHVPPSRVLPLSDRHIKTDYMRGERVRANWQSCGTWCLGRICMVNGAEGTFDVQYDDGEVESHVAAHSLQPADDVEPKSDTGTSEPLPFACSLVGKSPLSPLAGHPVV